MPLDKQTVDSEEVVEGGVTAASVSGCSVIPENIVESGPDPGSPGRIRV